MRLIVGQFGKEGFPFKRRKLTSSRKMVGKEVKIFSSVFVIQGFLKLNAYPRSCIAILGRDKSNRDFKTWTTVPHIFISYTV